MLIAYQAEIQDHRFANIILIRKCTDGTPGVCEKSALLKKIEKIYH